MRQICYGLPYEKQLLYELRIAHSHFSWCAPIHLEMLLGSWLHIKMVLE